MELIWWDNAQLCEKQSEKQSEDSFVDHAKEEKASERAKSQNFRIYAFTREYNEESHKTPVGTGSRREFSKIQILAR
jgi:hypothetical protein